MPRLATDENFMGPILAGLRQAEPSLDIVRIQDSPVAEKHDRMILEWCAQEDRVLLTHDHDDMIGFAYERIIAGLPMSGVIEVSDRIPIGRAVTDLLLLLFGSFDDEWHDQVHYLSF